jgi:hypothetical protein
VKTGVQVSYLMSFKSIIPDSQERLYAQISTCGEGSGCDSVGLNGFDILHFYEDATKYMDHTLSSFFDPQHYSLKFRLKSINNVCNEALV